MIMGSPRLLNLVRLATARAKGSWGGMGRTEWKGKDKFSHLFQQPDCSWLL